MFWNHGGMVEELRANPVHRNVFFNLCISDYGERHVELKLVAVE